MMFNTDSPPSTLSAMLLQEHNYTTENYFGTRDCRGAVSPEDRDKLVEWMLKVQDHFSWSHSTVETAINILDRFLLTRIGGWALLDIDGFQLVCMTCLYIAGKTCESSTTGGNAAAEYFVSSKSFAKMAKGHFCHQEIEVMEREVLLALQWIVHPPTSFDFIHEIVQQLPESMVLNGSAAPSETRQHIEDQAYNLAQGRLEGLKSRQDVHAKKSMVAVAAVSEVLAVSFDMQGVILIDCLADLEVLSPYRQWIPYIQKELEDHAFGLDSSFEDHMMMSWEPSPPIKPPCETSMHNIPPHPDSPRTVVYKFYD